MLVGSRLGPCCETDEADTDRATPIHLLEGQYSSPVRVVAFNTAEGWSGDVTEEIAAELAQAWLAKACADRGLHRRPHQGEPSALIGNLA